MTLIFVHDPVHLLNVQSAIQRFMPFVSAGSTRKSLANQLGPIARPE